MSNIDPDDPALDPIFRAGYKAGFEAGLASAPKGLDFGFGKPCAKCGEPVWMPTNRYMKAPIGAGGRIWHGDCFPADGVSGSFTI